MDYAKTYNLSLDNDVHDVQYILGMRLTRENLSFCQQSLLTMVIIGMMLTLILKN